MSRNDPVDLAVAFVHATSAAVLVEQAGVQAWLPLAQITTDSDIDHLEKGELFELSVPEWLAYEKGLI